MVQLVEVEDEHFVAGQIGPDDDDDYSDTDSEISTQSDFDPSSESLSDRLWALRDIIPPSTRAWWAARASATSQTTTALASTASKGLWALSSTVIFLGVPFALCWMEEQQVLAMEQEFKMREQGDQLLSAGAPGAGDALSGDNILEGNTASQVGAALAKPAV
ncbi:Mitochondrial import receptor subunit tom22 [Ceratocystis lukuohia]|uniref:Mitochondrial import receptor subunit tom-22 n=3 Tax=Ceratocystis TaxID=5157 RepID=A0A0F8DEG2_CERFI|nr:Mitochondrial import receptor subunit tom-22 [Ceratocystis platani]PHH51278.1 Mitochondrial import receptor subunit tom22 [Ceratocystis fimbriata CBS 114723]